MLSMSPDNQRAYILNNKTAPGDLCRHTLERAVNPARPSDLTIEEIQAKMADLEIPVIREIVEIALRMAGYKKTKIRVPGMDDKDLKWHEFYKLDPVIRTELDLIAMKAENAELKAAVERLSNMKPDRKTGSKR